MRRSRRSLRRAVIVGVAVAIAAAVAVVAPAGAPDQHGARVLRFTIRSRFVHQALVEVEVVPRGTTGAGRPLLVFLHGRGSDGEDSNLSSEMFRALAEQGVSAPDIVFPNGGEASYWHDRGNGAWAAYVMREVIPSALARVHADAHRVAIGGISMGGFGALDIARLDPHRFCAVGAHSAALWFRGADSASGAFDDAGDFARHDLIALAARTNPYGRTPLWLDVGTDDPFHAADTVLVRELRARGADVRFHTGPGGHDGDYWGPNWTRYLHFYATQLRACGA